MGQDDIFRLLNKKRIWLNAQDIAKTTKVGIRSTRLRLKKMRERGEIEFKKKDRIYIYRVK